MKYTSIITVLFVVLFSACNSTINIEKDVDITPDIFPDYRQVTVPVNIAPLNFRIENNCSAILVTFSDKTGYSFSEKGRNSIEIPKKRWQKLLENAAGDSIQVAVFAKIDKQWTSYKPFGIYVSLDSIDCRLVYRRIAPGYEIYSHMGIFQRDLTSFNEKPIIENTLYRGRCVNCHSFCENEAKNMMFHLRGKSGGTFLVQDGKLCKLNGKTPRTIGNFQYPYWHPSGKYIAYSVNKTMQDFHSHDKNRIEVYDNESDLIVYDIDKNTILTCDEIFSKSSFETWPTFSPDGKYLYFASAKALQMPQNFDKIKYSLCRIAFDANTGEFGNVVDTLINAEETNKSVAFPRISPDGNYLVYTCFDYGNFPIWHNEADLYMFDLQSWNCQSLDEINSSNVESYHSWSSNGNWLVFSSRRVNGLYTMPFIVHFNDNRQFEKPFLLPQKSSEYYDLSLYSFNIPEFVTTKIELSIPKVEQEMKESGIDVLFGF